MGKNTDMLAACMKEKRPFIAFDVEATGIFDGNDNRITQIAAAAYAYNPSESRYELQDHIFMLAKANPDVIANIQNKQVPNETNAAKYLENDFVQNAKSHIKNMDSLVNRYNYPTKLKEAEGRLAAGGLTDKEEKKLKNNIVKYKTAIAEAKKECDNDEEYQLYKGLSDEELLALPECKAYVSANIGFRIAEMENEYKVEKVLKEQGIDMKEWLSSGEGLTTAELQTGLNEFFSKYCKDNTSIITNGTYYAKHYMEKENMVFPENGELIDIVQANKGQYGKFTWDFTDFANQYKAQTGREIKTFDAFTKCLCLAEMSCCAGRTACRHNSVQHLTNSVKEKAFSMDSDYVMSSVRASSMHWNVVKDPCFMQADYIFDAREYVQLGNDRRYVDLDKMFEVNDNFEVTLEGEKTPIKNWDELESKIKALNADISDELLDHIKEKYEQIEQKAKDDKQKWEEHKLTAAAPSFSVDQPQNKGTPSGGENLEQSAYNSSSFDHKEKEEYRTSEIAEKDKISEPPQLTPLQAMLQAQIDKFDVEIAKTYLATEEANEDYDKTILDTLESAEKELPDLINFAKDIERRMYQVNNGVPFVGMFNHYLKVHINPDNLTLREAKPFIDKCSFEEIMNPRENAIPYQAFGLDAPLSDIKTAELAQHMIPPAFVLDFAPSESVGFARNGAKVPLYSSEKGYFTHCGTALDRLVDRSAILNEVKEFFAVNYGAIKTGIIQDLSNQLSQCIARKQKDTETQKNKTKKMQTYFEK